MTILKKLNSVCFSHMGSIDIVGKICISFTWRVMILLISPKLIEDTLHASSLFDFIFNERHGQFVCFMLSSPDISEKGEIMRLLGCLYIGDQNCGSCSCCHIDTTTKAILLMLLVKASWNFTILACFFWEPFTFFNGFWLLIQTDWMNVVM